MFLYLSRTNFPSSCVKGKLIKRFEKQPEPECGSAIGVDEFAYKKRHTYGTIIVDEETHKPVAVLDGRDGAALKEWLRKNKQVKTITRDRASAYAKAVEEILPDCMQIAFLHHMEQFYQKRLIILQEKVFFSICGYMEN